MKRKLLDVLFGCSHEFSWPRREGGSYYQVCLLCGAEYSYDWKTMQRTEKIATAERAGKRSTVARRQSGKTHSTAGWRPRERRFKFEVEVQYRYVGDQEWRDAKAQNISRSGVMFRCDLALERGRALEMIFEMPEQISGQKDRKVICKGVVARCIAPAQEEEFFSVAATIESYRFLQFAMSVQGGEHTRSQPGLVM
ncbi:MAG TPA: PilZ domain-containing protein [Terriglobales bacterium]